MLQIVLLSALASPASADLDAAAALALHSAPVTTAAAPPANPWRWQPATDTEPGYWWRWKADVMAAKRAAGCTCTPAANCGCELTGVCACVAAGSRTGRRQQMSGVHVNPYVLAEPRHHTFVRPQP